MLCRVLPNFFELGRPGLVAALLSRRYLILVVFVIGLLQVRNTPGLVGLVYGRLFLLYGRPLPLPPVLLVVDVRVVGVECALVVDGFNLGGLKGDILSTEIGI